MYSNTAPVYCGSIDMNAVETDVTSQYTLVSPYSLSYINIEPTLVPNLGSPSPRPQYSSITFNTATVSVPVTRNINLCFNASYLPTMASYSQSCSVGTACSVSYNLPL